MEKLMDKLTNVVSESRLKWIRSRVVRMYSYWTKAMKELQSRVNVTDKAMKKVSTHHHKVLVVLTTFSAIAVVLPIWSEHVSTFAIAV